LGALPQAVPRASGELRSGPDARASKPESSQAPVNAISSPDSGIAYPIFLRGKNRIWADLHGFFFHSARPGPPFFFSLAGYWRWAGSAGGKNYRTGPRARPNLIDSRRNGRGAAGDDGPAPEASLKALFLMITAPYLTGPLGRDHPWRGSDRQPSSRSFARNHAPQRGKAALSLLASANLVWALRPSELGPSSFYLIPFRAPAPGCESIDSAGARNRFPNKRDDSGPLVFSRIDFPAARSVGNPGCRQSAKKPGQYRQAKNVVARRLGRGCSGR